LEATAEIGPGGDPDRARGVLARVLLLALDVDGCLTDGRVVLGPKGEIQAFDVHDGQGLKWLQGASVRVCWISGRGSRATRKRARELGIAELHTGVGSKEQVLRGVQARLGLSSEATAAMGDDLADLGLRRAAAFFAAPADAREEVRARADLVTSAPGGRGAVRELCEHILRAKGRWQAILDASG
jgi:3-deoxy-D-manno-octulosonate 8-phosphate phosphatase (KDO 8-P phosphatase)